MFARSILRAATFLALAALGAPALADEPAPLVEPPAPHVSMGKPRMVKGGPLPKGTETALGAVMPAMETCYREAIEAGHEGSPRIELRLELVAPGRVSSAVVNMSTDASAKLRGCVRDAFAGITAGGVGPAPAEVLLSITFDREIPDDLAMSPSSCSSECEGDMSDELRAEIRGRAMRAGLCFKRAAAPGEPAVLKGGTMQLSLRIADDGTVCGVASGNDAFSRPSLTSCLVETMSETFYNAPTGCVDVSIPLTFKGN